VRTVPIGKTTRAVLGDRGEGLVFTTRRGGAMMPKVTWQVWHAAADPAGIPAGEAWHALRHFHASLLIAGGASPVAVAHRLGHRNPAETLQTYAHLWPDDDERMRDTADGVVLLPRSEDDLAASAEPPAA
jgi:integrase